MLYPIRYHFSQYFAVSAEMAYRWSTDFSSQDPVLMNEKNQKREVTRKTIDTIILKETFHTDKGNIVKEKLVQLYPDRLSWISTHLSGANKYSQFIYEISAQSDCSSKLDFTALHLESREYMTKKEMETIAADLCRYDSEVWMVLAKAMEKDLK
jgi:hypothetical protein